MAKKYRFKSLKVKKKYAFERCPDWDNIIELNGKYFTLTGWMNTLTANVDWVLESIDDERLKNDKYLKTKLSNYILNKKGLRL